MIAVISGILTVLAPLVVFLIKRYWDKKAEEQESKKLALEMEKIAQKQSLDAAQKAKDQNESVNKQKEAAKDWGK